MSWLYVKIIVDLFQIVCQVCLLHSCDTQYLLLAISWTCFMSGICLVLLCQVFSTSVHEIFPVSSFQEPFLWYFVKLLVLAKQKKQKMHQNRTLLDDIDEPQCIYRLLPKDILRCSNPFIGFILNLSTYFDSVMISQSLFWVVTLEIETQGGIDASKGNRKS